MLTHTSGLHNALADIPRENPLLICDWDECLHRIAMSVPENEPGREQLYHYLSFGWLCGGIIEVSLHHYKNLLIILEPIKKTFLSIFRAFGSLNVPLRFSLISFSLVIILKIKHVGFVFITCLECDVNCVFKS